jgi:tol-pal system protein YbgF
MKVKQMRLTGSLLLMLTLSGSLLLPSVAQAQALTPEQVTLQVKRLIAHSQKSAVILNTVEKELGLVKQQLSKVERSVDNQTTIEMLQRVDALSDEVSQLHGELEKQSHDLAGLKKRQRELYLDTDRRLRDLESRSTQQVTSAPVGVSGLSEVDLPAIDLVGLGTDVVAVEPVVKPSTPQIPDDSTSVNTETNVTSSEEKGAYEAAFDTLKEGRYKKAKSELRAFLQNYPESSFASNAQYWLGEAHYVTREFKQGVEEFKKVLSSYPSSLKISDAMLKLGYTYYELKQFDQAKIQLEDLQKRFPKSTAFRLAGKRLDRIRKEGN